MQRLSERVAFFGQYSTFINKLHFQNRYLRCSMSNVPFTVTFLGTGTSAGVPMIACQCAVCTSSNEHDQRLRSSILIQSETTAVVVDSGPDFRQQMLKYRVNKLDAILFTHPHKDHIAGLDDVRAYNFFQKKSMHIYCNAITQRRLLNEFDYAFADERYEGVPQIEMNIIDLKPFYIGDLYFQPILVWHLRMPVYGFRVGNFTYITDANKIDEVEIAKFIDTEILVLNALRNEQHISHFTLNEAVAMANNTQAKKVFFTHMSHQIGLHKTINQQLPNHIKLAHDGLQILVSNANDSLS